MVGQSIVLQRPTPSYTDEGGKVVTVQTFGLRGL
jgi:hypothetical protein